MGIAGRNDGVAFRGAHCVSEMDYVTNRGESVFESHQFAILRYFSETCQTLRLFYLRANTSTGRDLSFAELQSDRAGSWKRGIGNRGGASLCGPKLVGEIFIAASSFRDGSG